MDGTTEYRKGQRVWVQPGFTWRKGRVIGRLSSGRWLVRIRSMGVHSVSSLELAPR